MEYTFSQIYTTWNLNSILFLFSVDSTYSRNALRILNIEWELLEGRGHVLFIISVYNSSGKNNRGSICVCMTFYDWKVKKIESCSYKIMFRNDQHFPDTFNTIFIQTAEILKRLDTLWKSHIAFFPHNHCNNNHTQA